MTLARFAGIVVSSSIGLALLAPVQAADAKPCDPTKSAKGAKGTSPAAQACNQDAVKKDVPAVITNEYLERLFGPAEPSKKEPGQQAGGEDPSDALKAMQDEKEKAQEQQALAADRDKKIADAEARVKALERQVLEFKNPLLPRPQLSKEEAEAQKGMNEAERVTRTQKQLEAARQELQKLQSGSSRSGT